MKKVDEGRRRLWLKRILLALASLIVADQLLLFTALSDGNFLGNPVAPFEQPLFSSTQRSLLAKFESSLANDRADFDRRSQFDPDLGWCPQRGQTRIRSEFDWAGSRLGPEPLPRERTEGLRLIGLVGCSFTLGFEVADHQTWAFGLDQRWPGTRVGNFAVEGYGVDQALVRYRRDLAPLEPDEVWLGFFPPVALRATSHFPPLYNRWRSRTIHFKPRFSLGDSGELQFHPSPARSPEDVVRLLHDPRAFLDALAGDPWIVRARAAYLPQGEHWTHRSAIARLLLTLHERRGRDLPTLLRDESSELFGLNRALVLALASEVEATGARFRMLVLPSRIELAELAERGRGYWHPFSESLEAQGIEILDLTDALHRTGVDASDEYWMRGGHHSPRTHELILEAIVEAWGE